MNYPEESVKPKLHILSYTFGQKAEQTGSIRLETEQLIESIHLFVIRKERRYASVRQPIQQKALVARSQWIASENELSNYVKWQTKLSKDVKRRFFFHNIYAIYSQLFL